MTDDPRTTVDGRPTPADPESVRIEGTIQLRAGEIPGAPPLMPGMPGIPGIPGIPGMPPGMEPVMPTLRGDVLPETTAPPSMPPARYELGAEIARGGMGRVVEATDTVLGRVVALKEALSHDPETLRRFARETRITARLEHPSIVPVHDGGIGPNGTPYYVMRKVSGRPLERMVAMADTLPARLALVPHMVAAARAIAHAHERGIVHRDIKPSNILAGDLGETIVIDWGLAKVIGEADEHGTPALVDPDDSLKTRAGIVYGTPGFMAPEQLRGKPVDARCDVYALGATLYHLLSRKPPHHAHTADEMMKAAVNAPPTPIGDLVPGVPPELSTIIDKALAHDPDQRYQDARALAEDLQRFLTGQLVASHHYTPRERLARFIKQNRIPVIAVTLAVLGLVIGGSISYVRVSNARDRADDSAQAARRDKAIAELQRARAEQRSDELTLSQARIVADTNPTLAVAMIKPLATKHWREVRSIGAAARAAGVAWSLPASAVTSSLELGQSGRIALAAGEDGVVRIYDLDHRTAQTVVETGAPALARFADQERKVVVWKDTKLRVVDRTGGGQREFTVPTPIRDLEVVGITAYWTDTTGGVWQLDLAGTQPLQLPLDERVAELAPSPDGRWIALAAEGHLLLFDRTQPATPPQEVTAGKTADLDWSADGSHLAALVDDSAFDVQMDPVPTIVHRLTVGDRFFVAYGNNQLYTIGPTGVAMVSRESSRPRRQIAGAPVGLREARGGTMIAGSEQGIAVISDRGDRSLGIPTGRITTVAASPRSPFVLAPTEGRLLVWNLDEIEPRVLASRPATAKFVGSDAVMVTFVDEPAQWIDLGTGKSQSLGSWPALTSAASAPSGQLAVVVDLAHHATLLAPGKPPQQLLGEVDLVGFATDQALLVGSLEGTLQLHDPTTGDRTTLVARKDPLIGIAWSRALEGQPTSAPRKAWVAAAFRDHTVWRMQLGASDGTTQRLPRKPSSSLLVRADGTVLFAVDRDLYAWRPDDRLERHATLPRSIIDLGAAGDAKLVAFTDAGAAYLVDLDHTDQVTDLEETLGPAASMSADTGLIVVADRGELRLIDPLVDHRRWTLASSANAAFSLPQLSNDGRRVMAQTPTSLLVWTLGLPGLAPATASPGAPRAPEDETAAWLEEMTNAVTGGGPKSLTWR